MNDIELITKIAKEQYRIEQSNSIRIKIKKQILSIAMLIIFIIVYSTGRLDSILQYLFN